MSEKHSDAEHGEQNRLIQQRRQEPSERKRKDERVQNSDFQHKDEQRERKKAECFGLKKKDKECRDCGIHRDATQIDPLNSPRL